MSDATPRPTAPAEPGPTGAAAKLDRLVRRAQADGRIPAVSAAVHRADRAPWTATVGDSGNPEHPLGPDSRFRIGSVTKTFTAVLVMQCRDDGLLDLDDRVDAHLDVPAHGELTVRRLVSHTSGLQREPHGDVWDSLVTPDTAQLVAELDRAERVLPTARRFHYSNLAVAVLGQIVAKRRGVSWSQALTERILQPLGLNATTLLRPPQAAVGYLVDAYTDHARPEPDVDLRGIAPAAQLWSSAPDMARWAAFLADPAAVDPQAAVLRPETIDEMRWPLTTTDEVRWGAGFGLGLNLVPQASSDTAERIVHVGHDGAMPGFLAAVYGRRGGAGTPGACGAAVLGSSGTGVEVNEVVHTLLSTAVGDDPAGIEPWTPGEPAPERYRSVLGRWWSEGFEYVFRWRDGALQANGAMDAKGRAPAVFEPVEPDVLRVVSGREAGELLRLARDAAGEVVEMHWATYRYTRAQKAFGER